MPLGLRFDAHFPLVHAAQPVLYLLQAALKVCLSSIWENTPNSFLPCIVVHFLSFP